MKKLPLFIFLACSVSALGLAQSTLAKPAITPPVRLALAAQNPLLPTIVNVGFNVYLKNNSEAALSTWFKDSPLAADKAEMERIRAKISEAEKTYGLMTGSEVFKLVPLSESTTIA